MHAVLCCCSCPLCVRGARANLNTVKRIVILHWNQSNHNNLSEKSKYSNEPKKYLVLPVLIDSQAPCTCWKPVSSPCCSCCCWPRWRLMSSGFSHLACRWLAPAVFCTGHGPSQFPVEAWRASRAFYTQAHNWPPLPACTYWQWHKYAPLGEHIHIQEHTYAHRYVSTDIGQH